MEPILFQGDAFSAYFCTHLLWTDPKLQPQLNQAGASESSKKATSELRYARRQLRDRSHARSTQNLLLPVFQSLLGWKLGDFEKVATAEGEEDAGQPILVGPEKRPVVQLMCLGPDDEFDVAPLGLHRRYSPTNSFPRVLRESQREYGILLNAARLRIVYATGMLPSLIEFDLTEIAEGTEPGVRAWKLLYTLLREPALAQTPSLLEQVRLLSKEHQQRVSTDLGFQVQQAVVRLMQGILDLNPDKLPAPVSPETLSRLYAESLRLLYRLLFVLFAEDRGLLPMDMPTYREGYSLKRLIQLARVAGDNSIEKQDPNGSFFQTSLEALFALLRQGVDLGTEGKIPAYSGALFDPSATKTISGLRWSNETIDKVIEALTHIPSRTGPLAKISFRELNVEELGSIYEGLLELSPAYADRQMWRVNLDGQILVIDDDMRARLTEKRTDIECDTNFRPLREEVIEEEDDDDEVAVATTEETESEPDGEDDADGDSESEAEETVAPARSAKKPLRVVRKPVDPGTVFLKGGMGRKQSGSYYTNRTFVDFNVRRAVDPLAAGKSAKQILALRVCDLAMGSGHFLVGACRRLAEHLLSAYRRELADLRTQYSTDDFTDDDLLILADLPDDLRFVWNSADEERILAACRLLIAGNCIYGVDKNPLAVDLAKVSIWLVTAASGQPLTFLDHRLVCGDSLLGLSPEELVTRYQSQKVKGKVWAAYPTLCSDMKALKEGLFTAGQEQLCAVLKRAYYLLGMLLRTIHDDPAAFAKHQAAHKALQLYLRPLHDLHQLRVGLAFSPVAGKIETHLPDQWLDQLVCYGDRLQMPPDDLQEKAGPLIAEGNRLQSLCWELVFPEVFFTTDGSRRTDAGFDILIGNPPWDKVLPFEKEFFASFDPTVIDYQGREAKQFVKSMMDRRADIRDGWHSYKLGTNLYAQKLLKDGLNKAQIDHVPNEKTGKTKVTGGHPDLFKFFAERFFTMLAPGTGRMAILIPAAFYASEGCKGLRRMVLENGRIEQLFSYENRWGIFPAVDSRFKFCTLVATKQQPDSTAEIETAFMMHNPEWLAASKEQQASRRIRVSPSFIREQSPTHLCLFEFRNEKEKQLVQRLYAQFPPLGRQLPDMWNVEITQELNMTASSWLFRERERLHVFGGMQHPGEYWTLPDKTWFESRPDQFVWAERTEGQLRGKEKIKTRRESQETVYQGFVLKIEENEKSPQIMVPGEKYVPLYEGRMIHQFDRAAKAYVGGSGRKAEWRDLGWNEKSLAPHFFLPLSWLSPMSTKERGAYCRITGQTNERSLMAAVIAPESAPGDTVPTFVSDSPDAHRLLVGLMNSLLYDRVVRFQIATHIDLFMIKMQRFVRLPMDAEATKEMLSQFAQCSNPSDAIRSISRARSDVAVARACDVSIAEMAIILQDFPLLDRDMPPLPGDGFIQYGAGGKAKFKPRSFITRDKLLLEYFRVLGEPPPNDIVKFFAEAGVDIDGGMVAAGAPASDPFNPPICATGPVRDLEQRVKLAEALGSVAYFPSQKGSWEPDGRFIPPALPEPLRSEWDTHIGEWIKSEGDTLGGTAVLKGTRLPVGVLWKEMQAGLTFEKLKYSYPQLTDELLAVAWMWGMRQ